MKAWVDQNPSNYIWTIKSAYCLQRLHQEQKKKWSSTLLILEFRWLKANFANISYSMYKWLTKKIEKPDTKTQRFICNHRWNQMSKSWHQYQRFISIALKPPIAYTGLGTGSISIQQYLIDHSTLDRVSITRNTFCVHDIQQRERGKSEERRGGYS